MYEKGSVNIQTYNNNAKVRNITLTDVLFTEELGTNLISTCKLSLKGCTTSLLLYNEGAEIIDKDHQWLGTANIKGGMYCLHVTSLLS